MRLILPSVTTHGTTASTWQDKVDEIIPLGLTEIGLFLTGLNLEQRGECYWRLLNVRRTHRFTIPFVHAVAGMSESEYWFLSDMFETRAFNLHPLREFPLEHTLGAEIRKQIFIENSSCMDKLRLEDINGFAGICLDISHLEESRLAYPTVYENNLSCLRQYPIGGNHISAARAKGEMSHGRMVYSHHVAKSAEDFSYLGHYGGEMFSNYCALELENSLREQLAFVEAVRKEIALVESNSFQAAA